MNRRTDKSIPVTINILSNFKISFDGKSPIFVLAVVLLYALAVSGIESETLINLIRSLIKAFLGS